MSKKTLSLALVRIMTLSLFTFPALAAGNELSIDKTEYSAGETITVT